MSRTISRATAIAIAIATASLSALPIALMTSASAAQPEGYGPSDPFIDALMPHHGPVEPMKDQSRIERTEYGYMLTSGQQHNRITVSLVNGRLKFRDTATRSWKGLPETCTARRVTTGISALCEVPATTSAEDATLLEIHPRLGNDYVDGRTLPAVFELSVLADAGNDTVFTGYGNDFINGAAGLDRLHGGAGNDWMRGGRDNDEMWGDAGNDYMVGQDGADAMDGGTGTNRIYS